MATLARSPRWVEFPSRKLGTDCARGLYVTEPTHRRASGPERQDAMPQQEQSQNLTLKKVSPFSRYATLLGRWQPGLFGCS